MIFESFAYFLNKIMLFSSFVNSASGFPKPLSPEEERKEFEKFKKGDIQAKNNLINHNLRLVAHIVKKYTGAGEADDLISVGTIGLIKAINTFEYDKNTQLSTYAARCIENEILMQIRKISKQKGEVSIDEPLTFDGDGNELLLSDVLCQEADVVSGGLESSVERQLLYSSLNKLNPREQYIMKLRFGLDGNEEKTQKEVAEMLGISQSYISRIEKKILGRMKKDLTNIM